MLWIKHFRFYQPVKTYQEAYKVAKLLYEYDKAMQQATLIPVLMIDNKEHKDWPQIYRRLDYINQAETEMERRVLQYDLDNIPLERIASDYDVDEEAVQEAITALRNRGVLDGL